MQGIHILAPPPPGTSAGTGMDLASAGQTGSTGLRRSATVRNKSLTNNDLGIKRVPTIADFNNLLEAGAGFNLSMTNHSGSNSSVAAATERKGSHREETLAVDLLRLLTIAKMGNSPQQGQKEGCEGGGGEISASKKQ